jgi:hypothetical protein
VRRLFVCCIILATATVSGCGGSGGNSLSAVALSAKQAAQATGVPVVQGGAPATGLGLAGNATLDLCFGNFPSESLRVQRYQVSFDDPNNRKQVLVSNEVVRYKAGGATQAFREVTAVAHTCTSMVLTSGRYSQPTVEPESPDLVSQQLTLAFSITPNPPPGASRPLPPMYQVLVYQYQGDLFDGVYVNRGDPQDALSSAHALAAVAAQKIRSAKAKGG